jgi:hypothetical protein
LSRFGLVSKNVHNFLYWETEARKSLEPTAFKARLGSIQPISKKKKKKPRLPVAHTCNPLYSGCRDQEDCSLKSARTRSSQDPVLKILFTKEAWWSGSSGTAPA